jgi:hypothetical protein
MQTVHVDGHGEQYIEVPLGYNLGLMRAKVFGLQEHIAPLG